eukprot:scaffold73311_cov63-Phaeocystis_antarctica.AAC.2
MVRKATASPVVRTTAGRLVRHGCCAVRANRARSSAASATMLKAQCHTDPPTESTWLGVGLGLGFGLGPRRAPACAWRVACARLVCVACVRGVCVRGVCVACACEGAALGSSSAPTACL